MALSERGRNSAPFEFPRSGAKPVGPPRRHPGSHETESHNFDTEKVGDSVDFETLDDIKVGGSIVIPKGSIAIATVTDVAPLFLFIHGKDITIQRS